MGGKITVNLKELY